MTQTLRRPPRQNSGIRRKGRIYLFTTLRVHESGPKVGLVLDGTIEDGYVGKTRQTLAQREQQHRGGSADGTPVSGEDLEEQPWFDVSVGGIQLLEQGSWTDDELAERETFWIHQVKPRYNYLDNLGNTSRIPKFTAREHRDSRDRAKGLTPRQWAPFKSRLNSANPAPAGPRRSHLSPKWRRRRNVALGWTSGWLVVFGAVWLFLALLVGPHWHLAWREWPILAAGMCAEPLVFRVRAGGKRKTRTLRRALAGLIAVATAVLMMIAD